MENDVRTLRGLLRRVLFAAPGLSRVGSRGTVPAAFEEAARAEGLEVDNAEPEGWIIWAPGEASGATTPPGSSGRAVAVVARSLDDEPFAHRVAERKARASTTLRDWVARWPMGPILRPFLAPDAVGSRSCQAELPGSTEWVFTAHPPPVDVASGGGRKRELLVTFCGSGFFPIMPATLASALLLPPALLVFFLSHAAFDALCFAVAVAATIASVALERWAARWFLAEDPREFVLDEVAGMAFAWAILPAGAGWPYVLLAFLLFRLFDIFKWGVSWIETLPVRGKIVWDDLLAGLYAGLVCVGIHALVGPLV